MRGEKPWQGSLLCKFCGLAVAMTGLLSARSVQAAAPGRHVSGDYLLSANGRRIDVVRVPMPEPSSGCIDNRLEWQPYSYASFVATGTVEVCVQSGFLDLSKTEILPASKHVVPLQRTNDTVTFRMTSPMTIVLEPKGRHRALVVSANLPERNPPRRDDPKVRYFGPGFHRADQIALGDGETLYLAEGAWVEGWLQANGKNMTVCGSGVLSGAFRNWHDWENKKKPKDAGNINLSGRLATMAGEGITVRDATFFSSWGWTLVFNCVTNVLVDNVKVIGGRVINDDGIDICRGRDVEIRNSFVRSQDDCITPKYWCENLVCTNLTLWTDAANAFRTGYECSPGASGLVYRNLLFKDIDILHLALNKRSPDHPWANCAICIQPANGQTMYGTTYEDIRFYEVGPKDVFLKVMTMPITMGSTLCRTDEAGVLADLTLRNIHLPDSNGGMCVFLSAHDEAHPVRNVRFEDVTGFGRIRRKGAVSIVTDLAKEAH